MSGGNSALAILDDADLDRAVSAGAWGSFLHQGQICMTAGRHLVHERVADSYVDALAAHADGLPVGDPSAGEVALGPLIDEGQRAKVHSLVTATVDAGARLAAGGTHDGLFYRPTVLALRGSPASPHRDLPPREDLRRAVSTRSGARGCWMAIRVGGADCVVESDEGRSQCHLLKPFGLVRCRTEQCCADQEGVHLGRRLEMDRQRPGGVMSDRTTSSTSVTAQTISDLRK